jgi:hypothetical protein
MRKVNHGAARMGWVYSHAIVVVEIMCAFRNFPRLFTDTKTGCNFNRDSSSSSFSSSCEDGTSGLSVREVVSHDATKASRAPTESIVRGDFLVCHIGKAIPGGICPNSLRLNGQLQGASLVRADADYI